MSRDKKKPLVPRHPWQPADYEIEDAGAVQALARGEAAPHQQRRVLDFVINTLSGYYDISFRPESARDTDFAEGKRFVGAQLVKLTKLRLSALTDEPSEQG